MPIKKIIPILKLIYTPLSLVCILYFCWLNQDLIEKIANYSNLGLLFCSIMCWGILHLLAPLSPRIVLPHMGGALKYNQLLAIHIQQIPARYLPGGVWHTVGRMTAYHLSGISKKSVAFYALIETLAPCLVTLLWGGAILFFSIKTREHAFFYCGFALIQVCIIIIIPIAMKFRRSFNFTKKIFLSYSYFFLVGSFYWLVATVSFLFYYRAFSFFSLENSLPSLLHLIGSYLFSWGIGYIAVFAPQGIGVFEVVAGKLINFPMDLGGAVVFMAGFRLVAFAADITIWCLYKIFLFSGNRKNTIMISKDT